MAITMPSYLQAWPAQKRSSIEKARHAEPLESSRSMLKWSRIAQILDLLVEDRWRRVYAGQLEVRPPGAPTAVPDRRRSAVGWRYAASFAWFDRGIQVGLNASWAD